MRITFLDLRPPLKSAGTFEPPFGSGPARMASPALLCRAAEAAAAGHEVAYHFMDQGGPIPEGVSGCDRLVVRGPVPPDLGAREVEIVDPWAAPATGVPGYALAGPGVGHAEADVDPMREPVHPWACPSVSPTTPDRQDERLAAAVRALCGPPEAPLWLNDERVPVTMDRLRRLAEHVRAALRDHGTILQLHVRAWPADLLAERVLDHLSLLPVASLDLLAGALRDGPLAQRGGPLPAAEVARYAAEVLRAGLAHLTRLSLVLALPGEDADGCVATINEAFRLCQACRIQRLRFSFWLGEHAGPAPADPAERTRRFLAAHPGWHEVEYQGVQDYLALTSLAHRQIKIIGP